MKKGDAIRSVRIARGWTQKQLANACNYERSFIAKVETGEREWPEESDHKLARWSWKMALKIADERTGGYFSNILENMPNMDLHPAAWKEVLLRDLQEAISALEGLRMANHHDPQKQREIASKTYLEVKDVVDRGAVMLGVLEEMFDLDREELLKKYAMQIKKGER